MGRCAVRSATGGGQRTVYGSLSSYHAGAEARVPNLDVVDSGEFEAPLLSCTFLGKSYTENGDDFDSSLVCVS